MLVYTSPKKKRSSTLPLFLPLIGWISLILILMICMAMMLTVNYSLNTFQDKIDDILFSTVQTLADSPAVQNALRTGSCDPEMSVYLDRMVEYTTDLDHLTIVDANSIVVYHMDKPFIGQPFQSGDQDRALQGETYVCDTESPDFGWLHQAFAPVLDADGQVMGFIAASTSHQRINDLRNHIYKTYVSLFLILLLCATVFSLVLAVHLNRTLHGVRLEDLVRSYLTQNEVLESLDEGLISLDSRGKVKLVNRAAAEALHCHEGQLLDVHVDRLLRKENGQTLWGITGENLPTSRTEILASSILISNTQGHSRQVLILKDKTELLQQAEQLNGTRHIITALRANSHEFTNKLQVISGLLQMGNTEDALAYIGNLSTVNSREMRPVMQLIHNPNVAALLLGKLSNMRELGIQFTVLLNSALPLYSRYLSTDELVTVVGNLVENAIEAVDPLPPDADRSVELQITEDDRGLLIVVSDSGKGIPPDVMDRIFENGFTTKAADGRGVGMTQIRRILDRHHGSIEIDSEPGNGSIFTLIFNEPRGGRNL